MPRVSQLDAWRCNANEPQTVIVATSGKRLAGAVYDFAAVYFHDGGQLSVNTDDGLQSRNGCWCGRFGWCLDWFVRTVRARHFWQSCRQRRPGATRLRYVGHLLIQQSSTRILFEQFSDEMRRRRRWRGWGDCQIA